MQASEQVSQVFVPDEVAQLPVKPRRKFPLKSVLAGFLALLVGVGIGIAGSPDTEAAEGLRQAAAEIRTLEGRTEDLISENSALEDEVSVLGTEVTDLESKLLDAEAAATKAEEKAAGNGKGINVDYGQWDGLFSISGTTLTYDYGWELVGQIEYLGGADCPLGYVQVDATYFAGGKIIGTDYTNFTNMSEGSRLPLQIYGPGAKPDRVDIVMSDASCG